MNRIVSLNSNLTSGQKSPPTVISRFAEVGVITLDAKKTYNSLNHEMRTSLISSLKSLSEDPKIKVVCLKSFHPKVFCAGANIKDLEQSNHESWLLNDVFADLDFTLRSYNKPLICAVNRLALGGGMEISILCDIILASEDAQFGFPEIKLGLMPGLGGTLIAKNIGK